MYSIPKEVVARREVILNANQEVNFNQEQRTRHSIFKNVLPRDMFARAFSLKFLQLPTNFNDAESNFEEFENILSFSGGSKVNMRVFPLHFLHVECGTRDQTIPPIDQNENSQLRQAASYLAASTKTVKFQDSPLYNAGNVFHAQQEDKVLILENWLCYNSPRELSPQLILNSSLYPYPLSISERRNDSNITFNSFASTFTAEKFVESFNRSLSNIIAHERTMMNDLDYYSSFMYNATNELMTFNDFQTIYFNRFEEGNVNADRNIRHQFIDQEPTSRAVYPPVTRNSFFSHLILSYDGAKNLFSLNYGFEKTKYAIPNIKGFENLKIIHVNGANPGDAHTIENVNEPLPQEEMLAFDRLQNMSYLSNILIAVDTYIACDKMDYEIRSPDDFTYIQGRIDALKQETNAVVPHILSLAEFWKIMGNSETNKRKCRRFLFKTSNSLCQRFGLQKIKITDPHRLLTHSKWASANVVNKPAWIQNHGNAAPYEPNIDLVYNEDLTDYNLGYINAVDSLDEGIKKQGVYTNILSERYPESLCSHIFGPWFFGSSHQEYKEGMQFVGNGVSPISELANEELYFQSNESPNQNDWDCLGYLNGFFSSKIPNLKGCYSRRNNLNVMNYYIDGYSSQSVKGAVSSVAIRTILHKGSLIPHSTIDPEDDEESDYIMHGGRGMNLYSQISQTVRNNNPFIDPDTIKSHASNPLFLFGAVPATYSQAIKDTSVIADLRNEADARGQVNSTSVNNFTLGLGFYMSNLIPPYLKLHVRELSQKSYIPTLCITQMQKVNQFDEKIYTRFIHELDPNGANGDVKDQTVIAIIPMDTAWAGGEDTLKSNILTYQPSFDRSQIIPIMNSTFKEFTWWITDDQDNILTFPRQKPVVDLFFLD